MAKPRAGDWLDDEMSELTSLGVTALACMLTDAELTELNLRREGAAAEAAGLIFLRLPIADRGLPERAALDAIVSTLIAARSRGEHVVVHCRYGIGRSSLLAAAVLVAEGIALEEAWRLVGDARGRTVPDTPEQRAFIAGGVP